MSVALELPSADEVTDFISRNAAGAWRITADAVTNPSVDLATKKGTWTIVIGGIIAIILGALVFRGLAHALYSLRRRRSLRKGGNHRQNPQVRARPQYDSYGFRVDGHGRTWSAFGQEIDLTGQDKTRELRVINSPDKARKLEDEDGDSADPERAGKHKSSDLTEV